MSNRPRHLFHAFASRFSAGGMEVLTCQIINHFGTKYRHTIFSMLQDYSARARIDSGIDVTCVERDFRKEAWTRTIPLFRGYLRRDPPDLLLTYNWGAIEWALANAVHPLCPHVHAEHGFSTQESGLAHVRRSVMRRVALGRAYRLVVPSIVLRNMAIHIWNFPPRRVEHIPNGIDCARYAAPHVPGNGALRRADEILIGCVGTLSSVKNHRRLIRASAPRLRSGAARLVLVGDGPELPALRTYAQELGVTERVIFAGQRENVAEVLSEVDIFCLSSDSEQMPMTVLEAMASGLAVVSTDVGDIREMVCDENRRFIVPLGDDGAFTRALQELCGSTELRRVLGARNRSTCTQRYDLAGVVARYGTLFEDAMGCHVSAGPNP